MLESMLNTNKNFASVGVIPVVQTVVGVGVVLKNLVGAVKDVVQIIFRYKKGTSASRYNLLLANRLNSNNNNYNYFNKKLINFFWNYSSYTNFELQKILEKIKFKYSSELLPLSAEQQLLITNGSERSSLVNEISCHYLNLRDQSKSFLSSCLEMKTPLKRFQDITKAAITAIPVVGTLYNIRSIFYIDSIM